ncbi:hypothetical protein [Roseateles sp. NT4]|uniref:hypothetical protein n=1 Tax=Roseateles sp. NT4 TaxID=3453715 RepID=UPI003F6EC25B
MTREPEGMEWRGRIVEMCKASLLDGAFHSLVFNQNRLRSGFACPPPPIDLSELYPEASDAQLTHALRAAERLESSGAHFAELFYGGQGQIASEVIRTLHPGFSDTCYSSVLHRAQVGAR